MRAQRLESLGQLAGGIAHDFNNLLAVIAGYATVLTGSLEDLEGRLPAATREALLEDVAEIARAAQRAGDLTHQLLAFARQESVRAEPLSLNEVIVDVRELLARTIGEHVQLETALADDLHPVLADEGQLGQVLVNLAVNARDAMPDGGRLIIETANVTLDEDDTREDAGLRSGPHVQMRVTDTGTGLAPDALEHAFDPFFTTKAAGGGAGLGLATVYGIITQAGGRATLYSEPGQGTTFSAIFPAVDGTRPDRAVVGTALELAPGRRAPTVLLVEDQPALRAVTARCSAAPGTASSPPAAGRKPSRPPARRRGRSTCCSPTSSCPTCSASSSPCSCTRSVRRSASSSPPGSPARRSSTAATSSRGRCCRSRSRPGSCSPRSRTRSTSPELARTIAPGD